jgi:hypothetical protein
MRIGQKQNFFNCMFENPLLLKVIAIFCTAMFLICYPNITKYLPKSGHILCLC